MRHLLVLFIWILALCLQTARCEEEEMQKYSDENLNYAISFTPDWQRVSSESKFISCTLTRGPGQAILIGAGETNLTLDDQIEKYKNEPRDPGRVEKKLGDESLSVAGEPARVFRAEVTNHNIKMLQLLTLVTHQGIAYRIVGISAEDDLGFTAEYIAFVKRFEFKGDRKGWREKSAGTPRPVALLGGLASLELNQPRWHELLNQLREDVPQTLEHAKFKLSTGAAWINLVAVKSKRGAAEELDDLTNSMRRLYTKSSVAQGPRDGSQAILTEEITGTGDATGLNRSIRTAVIAEDGITLRISLECVSGLRSETERDWKQILRTLKLRKQSDPDSAPAFAVVPESPQIERETSAELDAIRAAGQNIRPTTDIQDDVIAISPDGKKAIVSRQTGEALEDLQTHKQTPLKEALGRNAAPVFSSDGQSLAWVDGNQIKVMRLADGTLLNPKLPAREISFAGSGAELLVSTPIASHPGPRFGQNAKFGTSRLSNLKLEGEKESVLVNFPFSKTEHAALSPDGKRIALYCNRDDERTSAAHIYLCDADGSHLALLTRGIEKVSKIAWNADGSGLFVLGNNEKSTSLFAFNSDIYRVSVASGECINLTRCGSIYQAWFAGDDIFFDFQHPYNVNEEKRGIYRISSAQLQGIAQQLPEWQHSDPAILAGAISARVLSALRCKKLDKLKIDQDVLKTAAGAFADAAGAVAHIQLDFSSASLSRLSKVLDQCQTEKTTDRALLLGAGAYYGETLRRSAGATWKIKPLPFAEWFPVEYYEGNSLITVTLPFSSVWLYLNNSEQANLQTSTTLNQKRGQEMVLIYPPSAAAELVKEATDTDYLEAFRRLDKGEIEAASDLLEKCMVRHPHNSILAQEAITICEAAGLPELAGKLAHRAVENGNRVTDLLVRCGDEVATSDPQAALKFYRQATEQSYPGAQPFFKMGKCYAAQNRLDIAFSCWRKAYAYADSKVRFEIAKLIDPDSVMDQAPPTDLDIDE